MSLFKCNFDKSAYSIFGSVFNFFVKVVVVDNICLSSKTIKRMIVGG